MKNQRRLIAALCLLLTLPLHGYAERELVPKELHVRILHPKAPEPMETPPPEPEATLPPSAPVPTPEAETGNFLFLGHLTQSALLS